MVDIKKMSLRDRFDKRGFGVVKYARANKLSQPRLSEVLSGRAEGKQRTREGATRKVFRQLKADGIYLGALPWEVFYEQ